MISPDTCLMLSIIKIIELCHAQVQIGDINGADMQYGFGSDLMSDVLTLDNKMPLLITGLSNTQSIRTAEMADIDVVLIARGKEISKEMKEIASDSQILLLSSPFSMFKICGILFQNGLEPIY